ncbi:unnamed protein product, partial [Symbiodinium sp. KB8]
AAEKRQPATRSQTRRFATATIRIVEFYRVSVPCSPAIKNTESNDERVKKLVQRMSARHLDLIRELSEKNREKEEQLRREEQRQRKRESSLRTRILART